jgi:alkanesulfonate monooxygenase SsuD/methylene tetrahydromethanopterin reductase-like flavin-dependent oxidoreductase (luciferase family)
VRVGVSLRSSYAADPRTGAAWMVERARAASDAGLDSLFVGDHHSTGAGTSYYQNVPILGRLLAEWGQRTAGSVPERRAGALFLLPLWHPVLVAEQIGTLASIAEGPFVMQTAIGGGPPQFAAMGTPLRGRAARFEVALDAVRRLLAGDEVSDDDAASGYRFSGARIAPVTPEPLEVWIGATALAGIDRAARLGDAWLAPPELLPAEAGELAREYLARCAEHGRAPRAVAVRREVHVGPDAEAARAVAEPVVAGGYRGFHPDAFVVGSPEQVAEQLRDLAAMGYTDVIVRQLAAEQHDAVRSIELLAEVHTLVADA